MFKKIQKNAWADIGPGKWSIKASTGLQRTTEN